MTEAINGVAIALATYIVLLKIGIRQYLAYSINVIGLNISIEAMIDLLFTAILLVYFSGSYGGAMSAVIGGLLLSLLLFVTRKPTYLIILIIISIIGTIYYVQNN